MCAQCQQDAITTTSTAYPVYKQPPLTLDGIGNLRLHDVKPKMGDTLWSHRLQALVQLSAVSSDLPRTVPRSYTTAVSSTTASPTAANVCCCSVRRVSARAVASAPEQDLNQAPVPLHWTRQEYADFSYTVADSATSQVHVR